MNLLGITTGSSGIGLVVSLAMWALTIVAMVKIITKAGYSLGGSWCHWPRW